jgi:FtsP/CotA-like multicopper oxidase with cupredoxin domain
VVAEHQMQRIGQRTIPSRKLTVTPELRLQPNQVFQIEVVNEMFDDQNFTGQLGYAVGKDDIVPNDENIPGMIHPFGCFNIHLHGMQIVPHIFYNVGTDEVDANWIEICPGERFCYVIEVDETHPEATYLLHTHVHGSVMVQLYSNMFFVVTVGDVMSKAATPTDSKTILVSQVSIKNETVSSLSNFDESTGAVDTLGEYISYTLINGGLDPMIYTQPPKTVAVLEFGMRRESTVRSLRS